MTPPPPPYAEIRDCPHSALFTTLRQSAAETPALAFTCAGLLHTEEQRDRILRDAFVFAATQQPEIARRHLGAVLDKPWLTDAGYFPLTSLALSVAPASPEQARALLIQAARRFPALALREYREYIDLPFGKEIFQQAVFTAPDETVGLAGGTSATAQGIRENLQGLKTPEAEVLLRLALDTSMTDLARERAAVFYKRLAAGRSDCPAGAGFFPALVSLRLSTEGDEAALYDRVLEKYAEILLQSSASQELRPLSARDVYFILIYGRTEADDKRFDNVMDEWLLPKLRANRMPFAKLVEQTHALHLRKFLSDAAEHQRLYTVLDGRNEVLTTALHGIENVEDAVAAAEILAGIQDVPRLNYLKSIILEQYREDRPFYGLLAAQLSRKLPFGDGAFDRLATGFRAYFEVPGLLDAASLFDVSGISVEQQFFYDDEDGAESFESFRQIYTRDKNWTWDDHGWYVRVIGTGATGRRIEVYANVPGPGDRQHSLAKLMLEKNLTASVVIHRGHTWYAGESLRYLTPQSRLVYLGSCRGLTNAAAVLTVASRAQMIATRGIGTHAINDPLLKAINDELLRGSPVLDWQRFWSAQKIQFGRDGTFKDYISPDRNATAIMLAAYYQFLARS